MTKNFRYTFILIIPLITLIASFLSRAASGPFWQFGDPCFNYFFNAILIIKGHPPTDITHPGTPLQILVAIAIWIFNLGRPAAEAVTHALINPEFYLQTVYVFLVFSSFLTSVFLAVYVYRKTNDKLAALLTQLAQLSFLIMPSFDNGSFPVLPVVANVSAEPVFIIIMNLFNLFLLKLYFSENKSQELRHTLLLGLVCGLGLATKINFFIILLSALMLIPLRKKLLFIVVCLMSFVFCTWPIIGKYPQLFHWITDMLGHSSRYGMGPEGFIDWKSFLFYLNLMIRCDWFFILSALGLWIWSSIYVLKDHQNREVRFIWILSCCCLLHILATAKHFSFHYLLPGFSLFNLILLLFYLKQKIKYKILKPLTSVFILIFISACILYAIPYYKKLLVLTQDIRHFNDRLQAKYPPCAIIPSTTGDIDLFLNNQEVLQRANGTNFRLLSEDLYRLYPQSYYFFSEEVTAPDTNVESYGIWNFKQRVFADDIIATCPCSIFIKYASDFSSYPYQVRLLDQSKYLNAFLLINSTEKEATDLFSKALDSLKNGDYQQALVLGLRSRQLNYEPKGQLEYVLTIIYHDLLNSHFSPLNQRQ